MVAEVAVGVEVVVGVVTVVGVVVQVVFEVPRERVLPLDVVVWVVAEVVIEAVALVVNEITAVAVVT